MSDRTSSLWVTTENDIERAAADWLAQNASGQLLSERLNEFEKWLANPEHEVAVARMIIAELDAEFFTQDSGAVGS